MAALVGPHRLWFPSRLPAPPMRAGRRRRRGRADVVDFSLAGQVAIVTGGSKGLGLAIARGLAEAGASVALAARSAETLDQAVKEIESAGGKAVGVATDVTDAAAVRALVDQTVEAFGTVDILVNNAGVAPFFGNIE